MMNDSLLNIKKLAENHLDSVRKVCSDNNRVIKVGFDIDGVLANFSAAHRKLIEEYYHIDIPDDCYEDGCPKSWYLADVYPKLTRDIERESLTSIIPGVLNFWLNLSLFESDVKNIREQFSYYNRPGSEVEFYFISSRIPNPTTIETKTQTIIWLRENLKIANPNVIITNNKVDACKLLSIDIMIEDNLKNWCNLNKNGILCYLLEKPYNKNETWRFIYNFKNDVSHKDPISLMVEKMAFFMNNQDIYKDYLVNSVPEYFEKIKNRFFPCY